MTRERPHAVKRRENYWWIVWAFLALLWITILSAWLELALLAQDVAPGTTRWISNGVLVGSMYVLYHRMEGYWRDL